NSLANKSHPPSLKNSSTASPPSSPSTSTAKITETLIFNPSSTPLPTMSSNPSTIPPTTPLNSPPSSSLTQSVNHRNPDTTIGSSNTSKAGLSHVSARTGPAERQSAVTRRSRRASADRPGAAVLAAS